MNKRQRVFVIAEAGVNHNGKLSLALKLVDAASRAGADAVKFQDFKAEEVVTSAGKMAGYQKRNIGQEKSQLEMLRAFELTPKEWRKLAAYCREKKITFLSTPHGGFASVHRVHKLGVSAFKFGSGDLTNIPLLEYAARFKRPMIISTGMAVMKEVERAVKAIRKAGNNKITVLQCTTDYPSKPEEANLRVMNVFRKKLKTAVGYSDHTSDIFASVLASCLGAEMIEKHLTLDKNLPGPDHKASLEPDKFQEMVSLIRAIPAFMGSAVKKPSKSELAYRPLVRKSIVAARDIKKGEKLSRENLAIKRPGTGIRPEYFYKIMGAEALRNIETDSPVKLSDIWPRKKF
ncbi:MAG: N-acetylneuraminate synthase [Candidatus Niyogibacteria bacterium]|nr:MAG: N-acetylneuraminate synthase [Candidatus Niyogibacteria bacterium]